MTRFRVRLLLVLAVAALALTAQPRAQTLEIHVDDWNSPALRIGQDYVLKADDAVRQVLVIGGDATIEGRVDRDVIVILGKAQLGSTAVIDGSFVVIGGTAVAAEGAQVRRDLLVVGGLDAPSGFNPGGEHIVIGTAGLGRSLRGIVPWLTQGLLLARPIVPSLPWVWAVAGVCFLINLFLNVVFDAPVRAATVTLRTTPLSSFMTGLLVLLLIGPICVLLAVSVIGIAVIPFVLCAMLLAAVIGRIGVARWIGISVAGEDDPARRLTSLGAFLIGSAIICVAYMVPVLGFVTWTVIGVFGLGASTLAFFSAYRRENPKRPKTVPVPAPQPPPVPPAGPIAATPPLAFEATPPPAAYEAMPASTAFENAAGPAFASAPPAAAAAPGLLAFPRAAFGERLAAFALDFILVMILAQVLGSNSRDDDVIMRLLLILSLAYHVGFWTWRGTTLGGIICNLRVVRTDGSPLKFPEALVRGLTGIFSLIVLGIGFLWIIRDPEQQAWHDRVAGTYVVKVPRHWPI
jgi:uncharacterized RDD family membrane protein YckC